jgi:hypothetical protein
MAPKYLPPSLANRITIRSRYILTNSCSGLFKASLAWIVKNKHLTKALDEK